MIDDRCDNTISSFKNYTPCTYRYSDDKFEAGLLEIHIPFSWINLSKGNYIGVFDLVSGHLVRHGIIPVKAGYYDNINALISEINKVFEANFYGYYMDEFFPLERQSDGSTFQPRPTPFLNYYDQTKTVMYTITSGNGKAAKSGEKGDAFKVVKGMYARFTPQLAMLLGYDAYCFEYMVLSKPEKESEENSRRLIKARMNKFYPHMRLAEEVDFPEDLAEGVKTSQRRQRIMSFVSRLYKPEKLLLNYTNMVAQREPNIQPGIEEMFIYCSLIKHHPIGNSFKQLLRVTPVYPPSDSIRGLPIVLTYDRPFYFPLFDTSFDYIEVELRDRAGELIEFDSGSVIAIIELRRKKHGV